MANTYKNIVITPNISTLGNVPPTIQFSGGDATTNTDLTLKVYTTSNGTLSIEGSSGQLFSVTNDLTNSIFSVNDISGLPLIDINANGTIQLAPFGGNVYLSKNMRFDQVGNVGIGTTTPTSNLHVIGSANITGNLTVGGTYNINANAIVIGTSTSNVTISNTSITLGDLTFSNTISLNGALIPIYKRVNTDTLIGALAATTPTNWFATTGNVAVQGGVTYDIEGMLALVDTTVTHTQSLSILSTALVDDFAINVYHNDISGNNTTQISSTAATAIGRMYWAGVSNTTLGTMVVLNATSTVGRHITYIKGIIRFSTSGTIAPRFQISATGAALPAGYTANTILKGTYIALKPIEANTTTQTGTWTT